MHMGSRTPSSADEDFRAKFAYQDLFGQLKFLSNHFIVSFTLRRVAQRYLTAHIHHNLQRCSENATDESSL